MEKTDFRMRTSFGDADRNATFDAMHAIAQKVLPVTKSVCDVLHWTWDGFDAGQAARPSGTFGALGQSLDDGAPNSQGKSSCNDGYPPGW
jgi:hypothetical protein